MKENKVMKKYFILLCLGAFLLGLDNHIDNKFIEIIMLVIGLYFYYYGANNLAAKPLLKRIKALTFYSYINNQYLKALEDDFSTYSFTLDEDELKENKEYIDFYRKQHGSIVYKIKYELESNDCEYECKFVKAYDMNEKEWIDEQYKHIHLFRNINYLRYTQKAFLEQKETEVEFNNKKYLCIVTSFKLVDEYDENGDMMMEIDLVIIKEDEGEKEINKTVTVRAKDGSYEHTYIEENNG